MIIATTVTALWRGLLECVNLDTLAPKFPRDATERIRNLAAIARDEEDYEQNRTIALRELPESNSPELIFYAALKRAATLSGEARESAILAYMPLLEEALDTRRRCRVCGCTDYTSCICGCSWIAENLCSECFDEGGETV